MLNYKIFGSSEELVNFVNRNSCVVVSITESSDGWLTLFYQ